MKAISNINRYLLLILVLLCIVSTAGAQQSSLVQVKTFDLDLKAISELKISFDGRNYITTGSNGSVITEIDNSLLPPKVIYFENDKLEAESWNYSKGILEIIVREKLFENYRFNLVDRSGNKLENLTLKIKTDPPLEAITNNTGVIQLVVPVNTDLSRLELFEVDKYRITGTSITDNTVTVTAALIPPAPKIEAIPMVQESNQIDEFEIKSLDSITTLPRFWAFTRVLDLKSLSANDKRVLDSKFNQLWAMYSDSLLLSSMVAGDISDTSLINNDILYLTERAKLEGQLLNQNSEAFNKQITAISDKIDQGGSDLSDAERQKLLEEINELDRLVLTNEIKFKENQNDYQSTVTDLKNKLLDIQVLEEKLTEVEKQRLIDQEIFQKRLLIFLAVGLGLIILLLIFTYLLRRIASQKKALLAANKEVQNVNNNLEIIVAKRTETLQRVNEELDTFLYRSSHDLRQPLSAIIGLANIAKITLNEEAVELFEKTRLTANKMNGLLEKLIFISQINKLEDNTTINFPDIIEEIQDSCKEAIDQNGTEVIYNIQDNIEFVSEPKLIGYILRSLIENALIYSSFREDGKPVVEVTIHSDNGVLHFEVMDNGEGISKEISDNVWNMFYRGNLNSQGNGLGLYIVRRAVDILRGKITFDTEPGKFTKFIVEIPSYGAKLKAKASQDKKLLAAPV